MKKYLLSTGLVTDRVEYYIIDLFKLYLQVYPGDIPGSEIGFDFNMTDIKESDLSNEVEFRVQSLVSKIGERFSNGVRIEIESIELIDYKTARVVIMVNRVVSEDIIISLYGDTEVNMSV